MWHSFFYGLPLFLRIWIVASNNFDFNPDELKGLLSPGATISDPSTLPRWTDYGAPSPGAIVNVATEHDVKQTVGPRTETCLKLY